MRTSPCPSGPAMCTSCAPASASAKRACHSVREAQRLASEFIRSTLYGVMPSSR